MKHDPIDVRVQAILKRLLQVCSFQSPAFIAASMVLIHAVVNSPNKAGLKYQLFNRIEGAAGFVFEGQKIFKTFCLHCLLLYI